MNEEIKAQLNEISKIKRDNCIVCNKKDDGNFFISVNLPAIIACGECIKLLGKLNLIKKAD